MSAGLIQGPCVNNVECFDWFFLQVYDEGWRGTCAWASLSFQPHQGVVATNSTKARQNQACNGDQGPREQHAQAHWPRLAALGASFSSCQELGGVPEGRDVRTSVCLLLGMRPQVLPCVYPAF